MIISHKYKYIFIQIPQTASTTIGDELCINYGGERILYKHSLYFEFEKIATPEEKKYFVFACVRNPMDEVVSRYLKYKTNHMKCFTDPRYWQKNGGDGFVTNKELEQYQWIIDQDASFADFFLKYYRLPFTNWIGIKSNRYDYIMRFETIDKDFGKVLKLLKLLPKRSLPFTNKTNTKDDNVLSYFTPEIQDRVLFVFGPFMKKWGYSFPEDWNNQSVSWIAQLKFKLLEFAHKSYRQYVRKNRGGDLPIIFDRKPLRKTVWSAKEINLIKISKL